MSSIHVENNQLIKKGECVFYGYFLRFLWRNEKTGNSFFQISTKQKLILEQQYHKKSVIRNRETKEDIAWYTINCDGSKFCTPCYAEKTPVRITGYFLNERQSEYSWDFYITSIQEASASETVTIEYLASDAFPGITYENAVTIVRYHGADIFSFIQQENAAKQIQEETGMAAGTVKDMIQTIGETAAERRLFEFLGPLGVPYPFCAKAVKLYGTEAEDVIRTNPHKIGMKMGLSFRLCDHISKAIGYSCNYNGRLRAAARETLKLIGNEGHVWCSQSEYYNTLSRVLNTGSYDSDISLVNFLSTTSNIIGMRTYQEEQIFYSRNLYVAESRIAKNILRLAAVSGETQGWDPNLIAYAERACKMSYGLQQRQAFTTVLDRRGIKVINGGPGTGKTSTIKGILMVYQRLYPDHVIKLCAPTGRAAQRLSESTGMEASTVHRLLDYRPYGDSHTHKDVNNPIQADLIVVDETSMMFIELFDIFLAAVKTGTTLIFVGDINQLESVGAGSILSDLLQMPNDIVHKCTLTDVFRQKGGSPIIENSIRINQGITDLVTNDDFRIINTKNEEESLETVLKLSSSLYNAENPFETQILCPAKKGLAGITNLNTALQKLLNPGKKGLQYGNTLFRVHDKIMMIQNNYNSDANYFNGDIGVIKEIGASEVVAEIRDERYTIKRQQLDEMCLSYGMTIHKSQGSEFKNIIVVMPMEPHSMLTRNLFNTAVTRAKEKVFVVNEGTAMETAIKTGKSCRRRTTLLSQVYQMLGRKP